jgi:hypothetical protein
MESFLQHFRQQISLLFCLRPPFLVPLRIFSLFWGMPEPAPSGLCLPRQGGIGFPHLPEIFMEEPAGGQSKLFGLA